MQYNPKLILTSREINEGIPNFIYKQIIKKLIDRNMNIKESKILILGYTFKENFIDKRILKCYVINM